MRAVLILAAVALLVAPISEARHARGAVSAAVTLPSAPTGVGSIATLIGGVPTMANVTPTATVNDYIDWTAATAGTYPIASYNVYENGVKYTNTGSTTTHYNDASGTHTAGGVQPYYQISAVDSAGNEGPKSSSFILYIYHNALGIEDLNYQSSTGYPSEHVSILFAKGLNASCNVSDSTTQALPGETYSLQCVQIGINGLWQQAATFYAGTNSSEYGTFPYGFDLQKFPVLEMHYYPQVASEGAQLHAEYVATYTTYNDVQAAVGIGGSSSGGNLNTVPGVALSSGWNLVDIPISLLGFYNQIATYKWFIAEEGSTVYRTFYTADVGWRYGNVLPLYDGGAPNSYGTTNAGSLVTGHNYEITTVGTTSWTSIGASSDTVGVFFTATGAGSGTGVATNWFNDASTPLNGFSDNSGCTGASCTDTINYSYAAANLTQLTPGVTGEILGNSANGLVSPGIGTTWTNVISVSGTGAYWEVLDASGVSTSGYDHFTFSILPTNATHSWSVQPVTSSGTLTGTAVTIPGTAGTYCVYDNGAPSSGGFFTSCTISLSALGVSGTFYGVRISDTSGVSSNTWYLSAPGLYGIF